RNGPVPTATPVRHLESTRLDAAMPRGRRGPSRLCFAPSHGAGNPASHFRRRAPPRCGPGAGPLPLPARYGAADRGRAGALAGAHARGVMEIVRSAARELTGADGATFVLREGDLCYYADEDAIAPLWKGRRFPASACISGWTMLHREP